MDRPPGVSVRLKLTLSYAGFLMVAGVLLLVVVRLFLLRYVPDASNAGQPSTTRPVPPDPYSPSRSDLQEAFLPKALAALAGLLVFGLVGGWILAGRMLAPLARIRDATRRAAAGSLAHRIELEGRDDEFRELADAFDAMLAKLEAQVEEQRRFAANASHELRTPLAVTQTLLDVARHDPHRDVDALIDRLHAVNTRAIELSEALLVLSRADRGAFERERVDVSLVAEEATETLLPLAEQRGVTMETAGDVAVTTGSSTLLLQMAMNLVHNAIVHNLPERGSVRVATGARGSTVTLVVENTGEQLAPQLVSRLAEPFLRGTSRIHSDHAGVGLGLAIVRSIVAAHDGTLELDARPEGGLAARVTLPAARDQPAMRS